IDKSPFTEPTLNLIRKWDQDCLNSHVKCRESLPKLPSRVIDVRVANGKCKLVETKGASGRYMTLSHCWGTLRILTTVKENIDIHRRGIDLKALPKTFQDAIWMTDRLGIQYLWIDSLCIVQNDADDWARESALMAAIYSNSHLTLAATASKNGSEGLFKERAVDTFSMTVPGLAPLAASVMRRREHECLLNIDEESVDYFEDSLPLNTRAWVYQERLLSPRFLHFSTDELVWECRQLRACECGRVPQPRETENRSVDTPDRLFFQLPDAEKYWYQLIKKYTQLKITKDFDRLPAVSGIARRLMSAENYMAGLRKSHAISDLSWLTTSVKSKRPSVFQAPSWSWASVMGPII
ncbi:heterokaryon incompatibility protein-domain-containing protein, partial [Plectosphaerella plurivora]